MTAQQRGAPSIRARIYRALALALIAPWIRRARGERAFGGSGSSLGHQMGSGSGNWDIAPNPERPRVRAWFHAASVGELESLWPVILGWAELDRDLIVTIFSASARERLPRLRSAIDQVGKGKVRFLGFSPCEGEWQRRLSELKPAVLVTAKYEAWPELWASLSQQAIPLLILGAKPRGSLKACRLALELMGTPLPEMTLLAAGPADLNPLQALFPEAKVRLGVEPRWDQVLARSRAGHERAKALVERWSGLPRPWGILGSVWPEDLQRMNGTLSRIPGTLWAVPHRIEEPHLREIEAGLGRGFAPGTEAGIEGRGAPGPVPRSSANGIPSAGTRCVLIDEMGFLSELYAAADWAYVGGGFGQGVHSTIEPAIHGIPIAAGPARAEKFGEIEELTRTGQLALVKDASDWKAWIDGLEERLANRERWKSDSRERLGGTKFVLSALAEICDEIVSPDGAC